jgi:glycosyltransferase involved in cell wall biosynthesis
LIKPHESEAPYAWFKLATIWQAKGKVERAMTGYRKIIEAYPDYIPAQLELGNLLSRQGRLAEAEAHYRAAVLRHPDEPSLRKRLSDLLSLQTDRAFQSVPNSVPASDRRPDKRVRRVLLYTDRPGAYGAEQIGHMLMLHLVETGYAVDCAQPKALHQLIEARQRAGIRHLWLADDDIYSSAQPRAFSNHAEAEQVFTAAAADLVIFNDSCPVANLAAKEAAARRNMPYIVVNHCVSAAWAGLFAPHLPRLAEVYRRADAVVTVSQDNLTLLRRFFGLPANIGRVILNGRPACYFATLDAEARRRTRQELNVPHEAVVVFTAARMEPVKGYQYQIKALKQLRPRPVWPRLYFVWAGAGTLEGQLQAAVNHAGLEPHVKFLGERSDIPDLLNAADIFLLPSEYEGMPLSLIEAMAKGVPPVATWISGTPEAVGDAGKLLPDPRLDSQATVDELAATVERWASDPDLRQAVGRAARERAVALFDGEKMLSAYLEIIQQLEEGQ